MDIEWSPFCVRCGRYEMDWNSASSRYVLCKQCRRLAEEAWEVFGPFKEGFVAGDMDALDLLDFARTLREKAGEHGSEDNPIVAEMFESFADYVEESGLGYVLGDATRYTDDIKEYKGKAASTRKRATNVRVAKEISDRYGDEGSPVADDIISAHLGSDSDADYGKLEAEADGLEAKARNLEAKVDRLEEAMRGSPDIFRPATCKSCGAATWYRPDDFDTPSCHKCGNYIESTRESW